MKTLKQKFVFIVAACILPVWASAQIRTELTTLPAADQLTLVNFMMTHINTEVLRYHCDFMDVTGDMMLDIHDDENFLPFHRGYIEGMEDFLYLQTNNNTDPVNSQFIPLPSWEPVSTNPVPFDFQQVDADCPSASVNSQPTQCDHGVANVVGLDCDPGINWNPNNPKPANVVYPAICSLPFITGTTGLSWNIEVPYHNGVHNNMSGAMGFFTSPACPIFWNWHGYVDDMWKQYQCSCPSIMPDADLYMKDTRKIPHHERDLGDEPNIDNGPMWISDDIWVRQSQDVNFTTDVHQNPEYTAGSPVYIYVRVRNRGCQISSGDEELKLYWAKASTALGWPSPWDGVPIGGFPPMGDIIGIQTIDPLEPGDQHIYEFQWQPQDPDLYIPLFGTENGHFCLLARITNSNLPDDGMTTAETGNLYGNVQNNNNIVWKNITIHNDFMIVHGGGYTSTECVAVRGPEQPIGKVKFKFTVPPPEYENSIFRFAEVILKMQRKLFDKWVQGGRIGEGIQELPDKTIKILNRDAWIGNMDVGHQEIFGACVQFNIPLQIPHNMPERLTLDMTQVDVKYPENLTIGGERFIVEKPREGGRKPGGNSKDAITFADAFNLTPNPAKNNFNLTVRGKILEYRLNIYDAQGRGVYSQELAEKTTYNINVSGIQQGVYLIEMINKENNKRFVEKLVIQSAE